MKKFFGSLVVVIVLIVALVAIFKSPPASKSTSTSSATNSTSATTSTPTNTSTSTSSSKSQSYSTNDVAKHSSPSDCWLIISGSVYDVTNFLDQHRGGAERITPFCGQDATQAFQDQHSGQRQPASELQQLLIGKLQ